MAESVKELHPIIELQTPRNFYLCVTQKFLNLDQSDFFSTLTLLKYSIISFKLLKCAALSPTCLF